MVAFLLGVATTLVTVFLAVLLLSWVLGGGGWRWTWPWVQPWLAVALAYVAIALAAIWLR